MDTFDRVLILLIIAAFFGISVGITLSQRKDLECKMRRCPEVQVPVLHQGKCMCVLEAQ